jgi:hypothetical protein
MVFDVDVLGESKASVARKYGVMPATVAYAVTRFHETGTHADRPHTGRPRERDADTLQQIETLLKDPNVGSLRRTAAQLDLGGKHFPLSTLHGIAHIDLELHPAMQQNKPKLTDEHMQRRVAFALAHLDDDFETLARYVWVDEKYFDTDGARRSVWVGPDEDPPVHETRKHCPHSCVG